MPVDAPFREDYVAVEPDAAAALVERGVRLVGIDYLSVAPYGPRGREAHHTLLGAGVFVVEGLRLAEVAPGRCEFTVLPLPLAGLDGAPCRAFVGELEGTGA
jgi:arylformamidase